MDRSKFTLVFITLLCPLALLAQPQVEWVWQYYDTSSAHSIDLIDGGGCVVLGSEYHGFKTLHALDVDGNVLAEALYDSWGAHVCAANNGYFICTGAQLLQTDLSGVITDTLLSGDLGLMQRVNDRIFLTQTYHDSVYVWGEWEYRTWTSYSEYDLDGLHVEGGYIDDEVMAVHNFVRTSQGVPVIVYQSYSSSRFYVRYNGSFPNRWNYQDEPANYYIMPRIQCSPDAEGGLLVAMLFGIPFGDSDEYDPTIKLYHINLEGDTLWTRNFSEPLFRTPVFFDPDGLGGHFIMLDRQEMDPNVDIWHLNSAGSIIEQFAVELPAAFTVSDVVLNSNFEYYVAGQMFESTLGAYVAAVCKLTPLSPLWAPTNLTTVVHDDLLTLTWSDNRNVLPVSYEVQRADQVEGPYSMWNVVSDTFMTMPIQNIGAVGFLRVTAIPGQQ